MMLSFSNLAVSTAGSGFISKQLPLTITKGCTGGLLGVRSPASFSCCRGLLLSSKLSSPVAAKLKVPNSPMNSPYWVYGAPPLRT